MFITTANTFNMPRPLLDRMEVIQLAGYTEDEKAEIAKGHLIKKQIENHGLAKKEFELKDSGLNQIIRRYTREAGVRSLEREISKLCRKVLTLIVKGEKKSVKVDEKNIDEFLGVKKFKYGLAEEKDQIGVATGLAWTEVGGDLLSIEAIKVPGKGRMKTTGTLGDVMKESIDAASSFVRSKSPEFGIKPTLFETSDIHVHVPEGATPKDGPSAGIAMVTSIVSMLTGIRIRREVAMTGEVTLRGHVLPIGGLKEKLLAALRGGIKTVIIPFENAKDLVEIPDNVKNSLEILPVSHVSEVLKIALVDKLVEIDWDFSEHEKASKIKKTSGEEAELPN
jgi:ATP-dependent Lon protease